MELVIAIVINKEVSLLAVRHFLVLFRKNVETIALIQGLIWDLGF